MKILDDKITFEAADFVTLSDGVLRALQFYTAPLSVEQFFSDRLNDSANAAQALYFQSTLPDFENLAVALAKADQPVRDAAQAFIDQAKTALGLEVVPAQPDPPAIVDPPV